MAGRVLHVPEPREDGILGITGRNWRQVGEIERGDLTRRYKIGGNMNMANLKDVKVIDMKDGNVTKIEHDGKEYEKVSEETSPKKGDIGLRVTVNYPEIMDVTEGE